MSDSEKYPNDRDFENVDDFEDDFDVPAYRKLAEPMDDTVAADDVETQIFPGVPETESETDSTSRKRYDAYAAAGRVKPQVIKPLAESTADRDFAEPTRALAADEIDDQAVTDLAVTGGVTEVFDRPDFAEPTTALEPGEPPATEPTPAAARAAASEGDDFFDEEEPEYRRGTTDFGLLLLRLGLGLLLLVHGLTTLLGWGGSGGTAALEERFHTNNFALAGTMAVAIPTAQLIAATLLILGLATPLGAGLALLLSVYLSMFEVATSDSGINIVGTGAGVMQLQLLMTAMALGLQFTGPGQIGVDFSRGWARRPLASSWVFAVLAIAAAVALWWATTNTLPFVR